MTALNYIATKKDIIFILVIIVLALSIRFLYFKDYLKNDAYPLLEDSDGYSYYIWARDIASGDSGSKAFMKWPLYAYLLALLFKLSNNSVFSVYAFQFILGAFNCILIYLIGRLIFNEVVGFIGALLCIWYALFVFYEGLLIYASVSLFLNSLLFLFYLLIQDNFNKRRLFLLGLFLGICTLVQANIIIFGLLASAWIILRKGPSVKNVVYNLLCFVFGLALVVGAATLRNYSAEKDFVLIAGNTGVNFYIGNNPGADGTFNCPLLLEPYQDGMFRNARLIAEFSTGKRLKTSGVSRFWFRKSLDFILQHPLNFIRLLSRKFIYLFSPVEFVHDQEYGHLAGRIGILNFLFLDLRLILPLACAGILLGLRKPKQGRALLYIFLAALSFSMILFFVTTRYRIVVVSSLAIFASFALFSAYNLLREKKYIKFIYLCAIFFVLFILLNYRLFIPDQARRLSDKNAAFHYYLSKAVIYERKIDLRNAMHYLAMAENIRPGSRQAALAFGTNYYRARDFKMAEEKFKEALKIFPLYVDAYYNLGFLYNQQGRFNEAEDALARAASLDPDDAAVHYELARAYKEKGEAQKAREEFNMALHKINRWRLEERALIEQELRELSK